ncbi:MAG: hypothetical protein ACJAYE_003228 [Candidatus Azotimanducaceae bacterium]|jgi:hypothetical protein
MRNLFLVVAIFGITLLVLNVNRDEGSILPQLASTSVDQEQFFEIAELFEQGKTFESMAEYGAYTVVEVYADKCGRCKVLEVNFPSLLRNRDDIVIKRVKTFSGTISFTKQSEADRWFNHQNAMLNFYQIKGTPHIEIYDHLGRPLAIDKMSNKPGTDLLTEILKSNS